MTGTGRLGGLARLSHQLSAAARDKAAPREKGGLAESANKGLRLPAPWKVDHPDVAGHIHEVENQDVARNGDLETLTKETSRRLPQPVKMVHRGWLPGGLFRVRPQLLLPQAAEAIPVGVIDE